MVEDLEKEYRYYLEHRQEFSRQYRGKVLVIYDELIIGIFESEVEATEETKKAHPIGAFLIQRC